MLKTPLLLVFTLFFTGYVVAQRGKDNNFTANGTGNQLNVYTSLTLNASANATSIAVGNNTLTNGFLTNALAPGDLILIIQMQGATIDVDYTYATASSGFTSAIGHSFDWWDYKHLWGQVLQYNNCGKYEFAEVRAIGAGTIELQCGLKNSYTAAGKVQVVRVPRLQNLIMNANATIVPQAWNGTTGGVVALEVNGNVTFNNNSKINVTGFGFRGGALSAGGSSIASGPTSDNFTGSQVATNGAERGEGIGGFTAEYSAMFSRYGNGAAANGGGGGNNQNAGGGGGANISNSATPYTGKGVPAAGYAAAWNLEAPGMATSSSPGGGRGGYSYSQSDQNALTTGPNNSLWNVDYRREEGGYGGHPLAYDATRVFMGGGGGAGHQNQNEGGAGGIGGGIAFLTVYGSVTGATNAGIEANGANGIGANQANTAAGVGQKKGNDGAGGAGGGGAIIISCASGLPANVTLSANGGNGGNQNLSLGQFVTANEADGPGGGGAGGMIAFTSGTPVQAVNGGANGVTNSSHLSEFPPNGATAGSPGVSGLPQNFFDLNVSNATICTGGTATLTATVVGTLPVGTGIAWYTQQFGGSAIDNDASFTTPVLTTTTTYWVGTCPGTFRKPVVVTVGGPSITGTASITHVTCTTSGSITGLSTSGGVAPVTIEWNGVVTPTMNLTNASAGTYNVVVTDDAGCTATAGPFTINSTGGPTINTTNMVVTNANCLGNNGSITGITTTGTIVSVSWNSGAYNTLNINNLPAGNYSLLVTDNLGCTASAGPIVVTQTAGPSISTTGMVISDETCGDDNGSITGIVATGNSLTYEWNGTTTTDEDLTGVPAGNYTLTVEDNLGCTATAGPFTIVNEAGPTISTTGMVITDEHCAQADGSITGITINGGTTPYTISWNAGAYNTLDIANLAAGNYNLLVTDDNGCQATSGPHAVVNVAGPTINTTNMVITGESCSGNDGSITGITASGTGLTYEWNLVTTASADLTNKPAGTYGLLVTDAFGCTAISGPHVIPGAVPMSLDVANVVITDASCPANSGSITGLQVVGGVNPEIEWSNMETTADITDLTAGTYTVTVTDDQGCTLTDDFTVGAIPPPVLVLSTSTITGEHCGQGDGSVTGITANGGEAPYSYQWESNPASANPDLLNAAAGDYDITLTDANGCTYSETVTVPSIGGPTIDESQLVVSPENCGQGDGAIDGLIINGSGPFTITWTNTSATTADIINMTAGTYTMTAEDNFGCTTTSSAIVVPAAGGPVANFNFSPAMPGPGEVVTFTDASTGPTVVTWSWDVDGANDVSDDPSMTQAFVVEGDHTVTLTVTSAAGCVSSVTQIVPVLGTIVIPNVITRNGDGVNDVFEIKNLKPGSELVIQNRWGNVVFQVDDYLNDWKGIDSAGEELVEGVYTYQLINAEGKVWQGFVHLLNR